MIFTMSNLKTWILDEAKGEPIEAVVIGELGWGDYGADDVPNYAEQPRNKLLTWEEGAPWLDYEFDRGYGAPRCNAVYAWTASRVIFISTYDGSTSPCSVPRNPVATKPDMFGG